MDHPGCRSPGGIGSVLAPFYKDFSGLLPDVLFSPFIRLMHYGWNNATNHKGGRAIWQIEDAGLLLLAYEECEDGRIREKQLLADYKAKNGSYPLANWRG